MKRYLAVALSVAAVLVAWPSAPDAAQNWCWDARAAQLDPNSAAYVSAMHKGNANVTTGNWGVATAIADGDDPVYSVPRTAQGGSLTVRIPEGTRPDPDGDGHLAVWDKVAGREYDFWQARYSSTTGRISSASAAVSFTAGWVNEQTTGWGGNAANTPLDAGLVRPEHIRDGRVPCTMQFGTRAIGLGSPRWPALKNTPTCSSSTCTDKIPEGTWVRLDPSVNVDALVIPAWQKVIAKGLQDHGMVLRDASGSFTIWGHTPVNGGLKWSDVGLSNSGSAAFSSGFPLSRLQVLQPPPDLGGLRTPFGAAAPDPDRDGAESVD